MKKYMPVIITLLLVCAILSGVMLHCTNVIAEKLSYVDGSLDSLSSSMNGIEYILSGQGEEEALMSIHMAASYLMLDANTVEQMLLDGQLEGTYFQAEDGSCIFVQEKLYQWCLKQLQ